MKTVIDAVNEYEAVPPKPCYMENKEQIIMAKKPFEGYLTGDLTTGDGVRDNEYWKVICTREEFNQCVDEMSKAEWIKPVTVPTFKPKLGESFLVGTLEADCRIKDFQNKEVVVIGLSVTDDNEHVITFEHPLIGIGCGLYFESWVLPLTPPITLEDGKAYQFELSFGDIWIGYYGEKRNSFFSDILLSNKLCGKSEASSIQLLGVTK